MDLTGSQRFHENGFVVIFVLVSELKMTLMTMRMPLRCVLEY